MSDHNDLVRRILDEVWNKRNLAVIDELVSPDFVFHDPMAPEAATGLESYKQFVHANLSAFPDLRFTVDDSISAGGIVATRWSVTATHAGYLAGNPPTGKTVAITGMNFARIVDGKFVESWGSWDTLGMMQQLGLLQPQAEKQAA
jgi:steroid delta-isomerase-like uncharacterized protein